MNKIIPIVVISLFLFGCGALNHHLENVNRAGKKIYKTRETYETKYIGRNKMILLNDFGKPSIKRNVLRSGTTYDEVWSYRTSGNWLGSDAGSVVWFFIKDDLILFIDVA